jgi:hypothetical protein
MVKTIMNKCVKTNTILKYGVKLSKKITTVSTVFLSIDLNRTFYKTIHFIEKFPF